ncbi:MAG: hypothetical protein FWF73_02990 [Spirochaetes bacterium]|nr:hypothetical protein [Spirochaetota bacterium]
MNMTKKVKQLLKKHVNIVKKMYPELYIEVDMIGGDILVSVDDSQDISKEAEYKAVILNFIKEYHRRGYFDIYWGVDSNLTCDDLSLLEDSDKIPGKENSKECVINF